MLHRTLKLEIGDVHVFETGIAANKFIRKTPGPLKVLCGKRFFFMRHENGAEIHVILTATRNERNEKILDAANQIAHHVENELEKEADECLLTM